MGKGSSKGHTPRETKDNLKSTQLLSVIDAISEGPIEGPVDGLKSVLLNSTPVLDSEGNTNISGVTVVFRAGEQEQTPPEGFESSGSETVLGTEVKYDTPITRTITSANIDRLRFTFGVQALVETTSKGDRNPSEVRLLVQIQRNGGWVTEKDITIKGKTTSQYLASVVVDNLPPRPFSIRMRRMTPDSTTDQLQNKTLWSSYTEIIDVKQGYPNTALVGVQVDSEQFGSQQVSRNYHLRGRILQVPSNYNPQTRQYSGIWDGTLKPAYSNNMAWCLWDMLTHPRYGMGKRLGAADVDKWALYVIGQYCDQSVPDGFGGTEPRITCNAYLAASINIKPGHDYYFYIRSVNTVGKSAFVEAVGRASDDAEGYLDFFKGQITESHLGKELLEKVDLTEDNASRLDEFSKEWQDANDKWNAMWGVKIEQTKDGKHYVAGIGLSMEDTEEGKLSQFLVAANRIAFIDPANGNETPMFVAQGNQIFMNDVFLKRLTAPAITSGGSPPVFSLTSDGRLTAKNADISGSVNANSGTLNNVTINQNCTIKGMLEATQVRGDFVKAVSKAFPKKVGTWGNTETPNGTVTVTISDDHNFDRQIIIPPIIFNGIAYDDPGSGNNPGGTRYTGYGFEVRKNGVLIASRETKGAIPGSYSAVIDMPSGGGSVTLEFKIFQKGNQGAGNITDCTVIVTKKAASGISIR
ncbi:DUF1983 domain-containing protein [Escherichia coli]|nr:DUF1983 domain-containing protein [Escherichia coli]